jgi:hypothetical protein
MRSFLMVSSAAPGRSARGTFLADKATRFAAIETALGLIEQGMTGVTIMGDDGRIYTRAEFVNLLEEGS